AAPDFRQGSDLALQCHQRGEGIVGVDRFVFPGRACLEGFGALVTLRRLAVFSAGLAATVVLTTAVTVPELFTRATLAGFLAVAAFALRAVTAFALRAVALRPIPLRTISLMTGTLRTVAARRATLGALEARLRRPGEGVIDLHLGGCGLGCSLTLSLT